MLGMKNWDEVYVLPLRLQSDGNWVYDANDVFVFQFEIDNKAICKDLLQIINGADDGIAKSIIPSGFHHEDGTIYSPYGEDYIIIRGWGWLTNVKKFPDVEAAHIQDTFAEFIVSKLNEKP